MNRGRAGIYEGDKKERNYAAVKVYRSSHKDRVRASHWATANKEQYKLNQRRAALMRQYGMTLEDYDRMFAEQDGKCAACGTDQTGNREVKNLCVDHAHVKGYETLPPEEKRKYVRGLLCQHCNRALGNIHDDLGILLNLINYLQKMVRR